MKKKLVAFCFGIGLLGLSLIPIESKAKEVQHGGCLFIHPDQDCPPCNLENCYCSDIVVNG